MIGRISNYLSYICVISVVLYSLNNSHASEDKIYEAKAKSLLDKCYIHADEKNYMFPQIQNEY